MKLTYLLTIYATILLTSCNDQSQVITSYRYMVVHPSEAMYYCPVLKEFPNWKTLTDAQVAKTVIQLQKNNLNCKSSMQSIKSFLDKEEKRLQSQEP
jgi:hypothetical protein